MKVSAAHWIDIHVGWLICVFLHAWQKVRKIFRPAPASRIAEPKNILIVKFWGMGSVLLTIPALRLLKRLHPQVRITFVTLRQNKDICRLIGEIDVVEAIDFSSGLLAFLSGTLRVLARLRKTYFDEAIDLEFFTKFSAIFTSFVRARVKIGFFERISWRGRLYDLEVPFNGYWHVTDNFINAVTGKEKEPASPVLAKLDLANRRDKYKIEVILREKGVDRSREKIIVINPNAGELVLLRRWPKESFARLAGGLLQRTAAHLLFVGSFKEHAYVQAIIEEARRISPGSRPRLFNLAGELSVDELAALLGAANLFISNDSGPLHLACSLGVPTISFFGPETPVLYGPRGEGHKVFFKNLSCSPCINVYNNKRPVCRHSSNICLSLIQVEEVLAEALKLLPE